MAEPVPDKPRAPPLDAARSAERRGPRALGRRIGAIVYWVVVVAVSVTAAVEVSYEVLFSPGPAAPYTSCHEGLLALHAAVVRARDTAAYTEAGENAALARFRDALQPEWTYRDGVASRCRGAPKDEGALDAIERLRYAEEHAVRREAGELAPLRRRVQAIVDRELGGARIERPPPGTGIPGPEPPAAPNRTP